MGEITVRKFFIAATGLIAALLLVAVARGDAQAATASGVVLTQRDAEGTSVLTLGPDAAKLSVTAEGDSSPSFETIVRYRARRAIAFDPSRRVYVDLSFAQALARVRQEHKRLVEPTMLPEGVAPPAPANERLGVQRLRGSVNVHGLPGLVSQVRQGGTTLRVTYASGIPEPPAELRRGLADSALHSDPLDRALGAQVGGVPVRVEVRVGNSWQRTLDTTSTRRMSLARTTFDLPRGYRRATQQAFFGSPVKVAGPSALVLPVDPKLPVVMHPRVTGLDWFSQSTNAGQALAVFLNTGALEEALRTPYGGKLAQYGVIRLPGKHTRTHNVGSNPPQSVGANSPEGTLQVWRMIWDQQIKGRAPVYWQCCVGRDPMIFIFVISENEVSYHFWVPTLGALVPYPLSLWIEPALPYTLIKVHHQARDGSDATLTQSEARNGASEAVGHEYVEAATDPFPFFGWVDLTRQPVWLNGEISDICEKDPHSVTGPINGLLFNTYWSNTDQRCVP